ncbi:MAG: EamA family transporter [Phycisphaerae bacterium]|nr:EamA family transporter [Phycisphaerae bacterium]
MPGRLKAEGLLLSAAIIWGGGFIAQKVGMDDIGPWAYTGARYGIALLAMLPLLWLPLPRRSSGSSKPRSTAALIIGGVLAGIGIAVGGILQQVGIERTSAGNAGFITGLYVILVPLLGLFVGYVVRITVWSGALVAIFGLYLLSVQGEREINPGDILVFLGTFAWAFQVLVIGWASPRTDPMRLAVLQIGVAAILTIIAAAIVEGFTLESLLAAKWPLLYSGILATSVAFTFQVIGQQRTPPAVAGMLLSLEAVFAAVAGYFLLGELLSTTQLIGCGLMLAGILISQVNPGRRRTFFKR